MRQVLLHCAVGTGLALAVAALASACLGLLQEWTLSPAAVYTSRNAVWARMPFEHRQVRIEALLAELLGEALVGAEMADLPEGPAPGSGTAGPGAVPAADGR